MLRVNGQFTRRFPFLPAPYNAILDVVFDDGSVTEPVTLTEVKNWCKIDVSEDDALITALITTARQQCELYTGISIIPRTVTAVLNNSCGGIFLPYGPVVSPVTSVRNSDGDLLVVDDDYTISGSRFPQLIDAWQDRITVVYNAGYKLTPTTGYEVLPQQFKTAILEQVFYLYQNRGEDYTVANRIGAVADVEMSPMAQVILKQLRRA